MSTSVPLEWDENKRRLVWYERGIDFKDLTDFDWDNCMEYLDTRRAYGEERWVSVGYLGKLLIVVVWTERVAARRIITCHKASDTIGRRYAEFQKTERAK